MISGLDLDLAVWNLLFYIAGNSTAINPIKTPRTISKGHVKVNSATLVPEFLFPERSIILERMTRRRVGTIRGMWVGNEQVGTGNQDVAATKGPASGEVTVGVLAQPYHPASCVTRHLLRWMTICNQAVIFNIVRNECE